VTSGSRDLAARFLAAAVRLLPSDRATWGFAMTGELAQLTDRGERWRFVFGCVRAILLTPPGRGEPGRGLVAAVGAVALGCVSVVAYGLVRYPGLRTGSAVWFVVLAFLGALVLYVLASMQVVARLTRLGDGLLGLGLLAGLVLAGLWLLIGATATSSTAAGVLPVVFIPLGSLAVGAAGAWRSRSATTGRQVAVLAAVIAGLVLFLGWVTMAVLTGGRPYDPGLLRDFQSSGAPDLATYAVDDNLGAGMMLLLLVPALTVSLGSVGSMIAGRLRAGRH
jgi:hypothetical protein